VPETCPKCGGQMVYGRWTYTRDEKWRTAEVRCRECGYTTTVREENK
jgi:DNA-directed RNA polymerase subunit RPC12/RpoP